MLETLHIENLALIDSLTIPFDSGFTILTGETGAGKSIILGALSLLFGDKVDSSIIRSGEHEAKVSAVISVPPNSPVIAYLEERGISLDGESLVITRIVRLNSRGVIYIQSQPMTLSDLSFISHSLFDIHGQSEHQSLLHSDKQRIILDSYGESAPLIKEYQEIYAKRQNLIEEIETTKEHIEMAKREQDYLSFVAHELEQAQLKEGEDDQLVEKINLLSQYETIHDNLELLYKHLKGASENPGSIVSTQNSLFAARKIAKVDQSAQDIVDRLDSVLLELDDISLNVRDRLSSMSFSQAELDSLQDRLALLQRLKKKYGPSLQSVIAMRDETNDKLALSQNSDDLINELMEKKRVIDQQLEKASSALTKHRQLWAKKLEILITERLRQLQMKHVIFTISITSHEYSFTGADSIDYLFSANLGEEPRRLKEIASGGELSRVMLAIKRVLGEKDDIDTLIFDEVDTGIGGAVAVAVGEQIAEIAANHQVIAISHLATIAAKADNHLVVQKQSEQGRTFTTIFPVTKSKRVEEIARMLSGHPDNNSAINHAKELLGDSKI